MTAKKFTRSPPAGPELVKLTPNGKLDAVRRQLAAMLRRDQPSVSKNDDRSSALLIRSIRRFHSVNGMGRWDSLTGSTTSIRLSTLNFAGSLAIDPPPCHPIDEAEGHQVEQLRVAAM